MKRIFDFGKIDFYRNGRKTNAVTVEMELRQRGGKKVYSVDPKTRERIETGETTPQYMELSICGYIWNNRKTDCVCGGQCLDTIKEFLPQLSGKGLFVEIYKLWKAYHLNGMNAGTPEQEKAVAEWLEAGNKYDYSAACEMLKTCGLYEIPFFGATTGRRYNGELYKYGHDWVISELPPCVMEKVENLIQNGMEAGKC